MRLFKKAGPIGTLMVSLEVSKDERWLAFRLFLSFLWQKFLSHEKR